MVLLVLSPQCLLTQRYEHLKLVHCLFIEGRPLTRYQFITILKRCLNALGVDSSKDNSHSFRIGAATSLQFKAFTVTSFKGQDNALSHFVHIFGNLTIPTTFILLIIHKLILGPLRVQIVESSIIIKREGLNLNIENTSVLWQEYSGIKLQYWLKTTEKMVELLPQPCPESVTCFLPQQQFGLLPCLD